MNLSAIFIRRPVMTTLIMAAFLLAGMFGYSVLAVSELPTIDYPTVNVQARVPGANAQTMAATVATPLEKRFATIPDVDSMNSRSSQGNTNISITFNLGRNIDLAAQDVQAAVSSTGGLPRDMPQPPTVRKQNPADAPIMILRLNSKTLPLSTVNEYSESVVLRNLSTLPGVAAVDITGESKRAVRIQADPQAMATRGIGIDQITAAVRSANVNQASGELEGPTRTAVIETEGQLNNAEQFRNQIVAYRNGKPVRLGDVANVIDSVSNLKNYSTFNGEPTLALQIRRQPGANTVAVVDAIRAVLPEVRAQLPPSVNLEIFFDRSESIRAAIHDVQLTLLFSALLVVAVIFIFLRKLSATFIPSIALPIALIGAFAGMAALGFSLNNLTLMALTLAVIFVVDDAIIMLENIMRHIEEGETPYAAAVKGSREVWGTILTMTLSLAAVFVPILFMEGILGRLLNEFAVTIVITIMVSGVVSVTLTPMLCSRMIRAQHAARGGRLSRFHERSEYYFKWLQTGYGNSLRWSLAHKRFIVGLFFASIVATYFMFRIMPQDFLPSEDLGQFNVQTEALTGTSFAEMVRRQAEVEKIIRANPNVVGLTSNVGGGFNGQGNNTGRFNVRLKPKGEREQTIEQIMAQLRRQIERVPGIRTFMNNPPSIRIGGIQSRSNYQYTLQDTDLRTLYGSAMRLRDALRTEPGFVDVDSDLDLTTPAVNVAIDRDAAAALGVSVQSIEGALGSAFGGQQISTIMTPFDQYDVILELLPQYQLDAASLARVYLSAGGGGTATGGGAATLVPLTAVTHVTPGSMALQENHVGQLPAVTISFGLEEGIPLSEAVDRLKAVEARIGIPATVLGSFQGTAQAFQRSMQGMGFLLVAGILVVYIMLGILYESFIHPLTILSGLPSAAAGALATLWLFDMSLTLYAYVGMIMLVGIVKKNAIMMIDFALVRQRTDGLDPETAITEAALVRFRPIMMTTMAALVGAVPIALAMGAGGEGRQPLGVAVVGGLVVSQALTLYITPVIYGYLDRFESWLSRSKPRRAHAPAE
jgi:hydrophobe/amphiphile efflux-1 (HAE1) family protein